LQKKKEKEGQEDCQRGKKDRPTGFIDRFSHFSTQKAIDSTANGAQPFSIGNEPRKKLSLSRLGCS
jgi:hypothetical protein